MENEQDQPDSGMETGDAGSQRRDEPDRARSAYDSWDYEDEEGWEEEPVTLAGEINSIDVPVNEEFIRNYAPAASNGIRGDLSGYDTLRSGKAEESKSGNGLNKSISDAYTEFGGELSPAQLPTGFEGRVREPERGQEVHSAVSLGGEDTGEGSKTYGWVAIVLAVASLFYWPAVLGPAAAIFGVVAYIRGSRALGVWSVVLGLLSLLAFLYLVPYYS